MGISDKIDDLTNDVLNIPEKQRAEEKEARQMKKAARQQARAQITQPLEMAMYMGMGGGIAAEGTNVINRQLEENQAKGEAKVDSVEASEAAAEETTNEYAANMDDETATKVGSEYSRVSQEFDDLRAEKARQDAERMNKTPSSESEYEDEEEITEDQEYVDEETFNDRAAAAARHFGGVFDEAETAPEQEEINIGAGA